MAARDVPKQLTFQLHVLANFQTSRCSGRGVSRSFVHMCRQYTVLIFFYKRFWLLEEPKIVLNLFLNLRKSELQCFIKSVLLDLKNKRVPKQVQSCILENQKVMPNCRHILSDLSLNAAAI